MSTLQTIATANSNSCIAPNEKRGRGRPPVTNKRTKYPSVNVRLTDEIHGTIVELANLCDCTHTALIIFAIYNLKDTMAKHPNIRPIVIDGIDKLSKRKKRKEDPENRRRVLARKKRQALEARIESTL